MNNELYKLFFEPSEVQLLHYYEPELGVFIVESPKVIDRAITAGYEAMALLVVESQLGAEGRELLNRLKLTEIPIKYVEYEEFIKGRDVNIINGMLCLMRRKRPLSIKELCQGKSRIAVLDNVTNPANVGTIIRAAAAMGMEACIVTTDSADPLYRRASRVSMGNVFVLPWTYGEPLKYIEELKQAGFKTVAMALRDDSYSIDDKELQEEEKLAVILGNEGWGLSDVTISACDYTVKIPMSPGVDSLNVSQASAVAFWELGKLGK